MIFLASSTFPTTNLFQCLISLYCDSRCLILRANGELSLLDLDDGHERGLTDSVELFWVTCEQSEENSNLIEDISWLDYGNRGMQVDNFLICFIISHCCFLLSKFAYSL